MHVCILIKPIVMRVRTGQFFGTIDMLHYQHATLIISNNDLFLWKMTAGEKEQGKNAKRRHDTDKKQQYCDILTEVNMTQIKNNSTVTF